MFETASALYTQWLPPPATAALLVTVGLVLAGFAGYAFGLLKRRRGVRTAYTRKLFHVVIFSTAMLIHATGDVRAVHAFAGGVVLVVVYACLRGTGDIVYESMARERDAPHRTFYILVPLVTTALGGLCSNALAGDFAMVGYLVTGFGDAIAEPVGARFGHHPYRVAVLMPVACTRTLEGSAAVLVASSAGAWLAMTCALGVPAAAAAGYALLVGIATAVVEAVSPHGSDNLTTMVAASVLAAWLA